MKINNIQNKQNMDQLTLPLKKRNVDKKIEVYTDGACKGNPGPAGLGIVILKEKKIIQISQFLGNKTNNIAELTAILEALKFLYTDRNNKIILNTDSEYSLGILTKKWNPKANKELIEEIKKIIKEFPELKINKVSAHVGIEYNELADMLANLAVQKKQNTVIEKNI